MTALAILLMTTAVPSADPVEQPPPASWDSPGDEGPRAGQRFSRLRVLFGRRSQGPQPPLGGAPPGGAGRLVPVPLSGTPTGPSPAMSRPEVTTPPMPPEMRRMPVGPADGK